MARLRTELSLLEGRAAKREQEHEREMATLRERVASLAQHNVDLQQMLAQHAILQSVFNIEPVLFSCVLIYKFLFFLYIYFKGIIIIVERGRQCKAERE